MGIDVRAYAIANQDVKRAACDRQDQLCIRRVIRPSAPLALAGGAGHGHGAAGWLDAKGPS